MLSTLRLSSGDPAQLEQAAALLRHGGTVAFPTETVYGLGANALNPQAVAKIFEAKQRPSWDPLIVHVASASMLNDLVRHIDAVSRTLMERFWPGPLTLLLPRTERIPDAVTAGRPLVGVRMPQHPVAFQLIQEAGVPIAAPSANRFGHTSPTAAAHVVADLDGRIDAVLDGGPCALGLESTVIEVVPGGIVVYRPGGVSVGELESLDGVGWVRMYERPQRHPDRQPVIDSPPESLPSPGVGIRHYAPRARLVLVPVDALDPEHSLLNALRAESASSTTVSAMLPEGWAILPGCRAFSWGPWHNAEALAHRLYEGLRTLDEAGSTVIVCPVPEMSGLGEAIRDRLQKAAAP